MQLWAARQNNLPLGYAGVPSINSSWRFSSVTYGAAGSIDSAVGPAGCLSGITIVRK
jgi:hypothetical protein